MSSLFLAIVRSVVVSFTTDSLKSNSIDSVLLFFCSGTCSYRQSVFFTVSGFCKPAFSFVSTGLVSAGSAGFCFMASSPAFIAILVLPMAGFLVGFTASVAGPPLRSSPFFLFQVLFLQLQDPFKVFLAHSLLAFDVPKFILFGFFQEAHFLIWRTLPPFLLLVRL